MNLDFGFNIYERKKGTPASSNDARIIWNSNRVLNHHMLILGGSGSGKTYQLRTIINQLRKEDPNVRFHIIDYHNDITIDNSSSIKFSEATQYGFNPLTINDDKDYGGVRKRVQSFLSAINRTGRKLGTKQESCLRNLLVDLYAANGFYADNPDSWKLNDGLDKNRKFPKKNPTLSDALKFAAFKLNALTLGSSNKAMAALEQLNRTVSRFYVKQKNLNKTTNQDDFNQITQEIEDLKTKCIEEYGNYISNIKNGNELNDLMKYDSKDVLKSVVERLENLNSIGIFKNEKPPFDESKNVWRYEIKALLQDEKKLFVNFFLEQTFARLFQMGAIPDNQSQRVREFIVIDEADVYFSDDPENILNIIVKEGRKFGIGLICASQNPKHFSEDFMTNVSTKMVLALDETLWASTEKSFNLKSGSLSYIVPQKTAYVQIKNKGESKNNFIPCLL